MAENLNEYNEIYRESCVFISAEIQGDLERKKGVLGGRSKQWCSLQGSTLYIQKKQSDAVETIDVQDIINVRKIANEYTGTQFEIIMKKKNIVFICPSSENCTDWVKALLTSMARKKASQHNNNNTVNSDSNHDDDSKHLYSEVNDLAISASDQSTSHNSKTESRSIPKLSDYTEPDDAICNVSKQICNHYWEVGDLKNDPVKSNLLSEVDNSNNNRASSTSSHDTNYAIAPTDLSSSLSGFSNADSLKNSAAKYSKTQDSCKDDYAQVNKIKKNSTLPDIPHTKTNPIVINSPLDDYGYASYNIISSNETESSAIKLSTQNEDSDLFKILYDALNDCGSPILDLIHPLSEEDRKPIDDLNDFLKDNKEVCRFSYSCIPIGNDPVSNLRSYLSNLKIFINSNDVADGQ